MKPKPTMGTMDATKRVLSAALEGRGVFQWGLRMEGYEWPKSMEVVG